MYVFNGGEKKKKKPRSFFCVKLGVTLGVSRTERVWLWFVVFTQR